MSLAAAIARMAAAGMARRVTREIADQAEADVVAAAVDQRHRAATHFTAGIGGWAAASHLAADRARLALLLGIDPAGFVPALLGRLARPRLPLVGEGRFPVTAEGSALDLTALKLPAAAAAGVLALGAEGGLQGIVAFDIVARDRIELRALPWRLRDAARRRGAPLPATLVLGAPPVCLAGAALSAAGGGEGWEHASALGDAPLVLARVGSDLTPAGVAAALYGALDLGPEGGRARLTVRRLVRQEAPLLHLLAGPFELERLRFEALGIEIAVARHLRNVEGGIDLLDVRALPETENRVVAVKFRPRVEGQSKTVLMAALSSPDLHPVVAIGVDEDIDLDDPRDLGWSIASRLHAEFDVATLRGLPLADGRGDPVAVDKWLIDATKPAVTQVERRAAFERAVPKNHGRIRLEDFLPE